MIKLIKTQPHMPFMLRFDRVNSMEEEKMNGFRIKTGREE